MEPRAVRTMAQVLRDMLVVFTNLRFMLFLIIASGFYILFWQIFYSFPFYVKETLHYERFELLETVDAWTDHPADRAGGCDGQGLETDSRHHPRVFHLPAWHGS